MLHKLTASIPRRASVVVGTLIGCLMCASAATSRAAEEQPLADMDGGWRHEGEVLSVAWHPNGRWIASGGDDGSTRVWDVETGKERLALIAHQNSVSRVAFSPDGKLLASISWNRRLGAKIEDAEPGYSLWFWETTTGRRVSSIFILDETRAAQRACISTRGARDFAFSADAQRVATTGHDARRSSQREMVKLWDAPHGWLLRTFDKPPAFERGDRSVVFSPDSRQLVTAGMYRPNSVGQAHEDFRNGHPATVSCTLRVWNIAGGTDREHEISFHGQLREFGYNPSSLRGELGGLLAFHPNGHILALGLHNGHVRLFTFPSLELSDEVSLPNESMTLAIAFSPGGRLLVTNGPDSLLWSQAEGQRPFRLLGAKSGVYSVAFSPDATRIVTGHANGEVVIWDANSGERIRIRAK